MEYINFSSANCKNCYKCLRACPVKAIRIESQQAKIVEERCIGCGHCLAVCPQNARQIISDLDLVKNALNSNKKVIASVAPSFPAHSTNVSPEKFISSLRKLGFSVVEETALGAEIISDLYKNSIEKSNSDNFITTCCPSVNYLIQKYYPALINYMLPFTSPMIAHGSLLKSEYGDDCFTVFIGPCVAKKIEANEYINTIDAILTFEELNDWLSESNIDFCSLEPSTFDKTASSKGAKFPSDSGILSSFKETIENKGMEIIIVNGIENCIELFDELSSGKLHNLCIEVNACKGSCVGGPKMITDEKSFYLRRKMVKDYLQTKSNMPFSRTLSEKRIENYRKDFSPIDLNIQKATDDEVSSIMKSMGKHDKSDELNCGVCGYDTCREKAKAVFEGMAEIEMCLNFMRNKSEKITNVIFENSPNVLILIDENLNIIELNPAAEEIFSTRAALIKGKPLSILMDTEDFTKVLTEKINILGKKVSLHKYNAIFIESILYLENQNIILLTMNNILEIEKNREELLRVKKETLNAAQEVVEKQMRVAQEIAGLLGETTAETKITLNKLKNIILNSEAGDF